MSKTYNFGGCEFRAWVANQNESNLFSESPIEALFAAALEMLLPGLNQYGRRQLGSASFAADHQFQFGKYRADVCLCVEVNYDDGHQAHIPVVAIECDGHDFHEKTKEQAAHDKKRDRWFAQQGVCLLRFTGSEIYKSPFERAFEVIQYAKSLIDKNQLESVIEGRRFAEVA